MHTDEDEKSPWPIVCSCKESWSQAEWEELPLIGTYDAGSEGKMELRTCVCGANLCFAGTAQAVT